MVQTAPGMEPFLLEELAGLGIKGELESGGVLCTLDLKSLARIHAESRIAGRVLIRIGRIRLAPLAEMAAKVRTMRWRPYLRPGVQVKVKLVGRPGKVRRDMVEKKLAYAIGDAVGRSRRPSGEATVLARADHGELTLSLDATGEHLHKRGWRKVGAHAPIRETLASGILWAAGWRPGTSLVDPMCGSGTFPIEAAMWASGRVHLDREFAFQDWPCVGKLPSAPRRKAVGGYVVGSDQSAQAVEASRKNARFAGVRVDFRCEPLDATGAPVGVKPGLLIANLPYGRRTGSGESVRSHFIMEARSQWPGWTAVWLEPAAWNRPKMPGIRQLVRFPNGGIPVIAWALGPELNP